MTSARELELLVKLLDRAAVLPAFELPTHVVHLLQAQRRPGPGRHPQRFAGSPARLLDLALPDMGGSEPGEQASTDLGGGVKQSQTGLERGLGSVEPAKPHVAQALLAGQPCAVEE